MNGPDFFFVAEPVVLANSVFLINCGYVLTTYLPACQWDNL